MMTKECPGASPFVDKHKSRPQRRSGCAQHPVSWNAVMTTIRIATTADASAIWSILRPIFRAGETYTIARDIDEADAIAYWCGRNHETFVAENNANILGTYYLRVTQAGGGDHVANCGYMTSAQAQGQGIARLMLEHSLVRAKERGFRAMQFNFVVSTNERAIRTRGGVRFCEGRLPTARLQASG